MLLVRLWSAQGSVLYSLGGFVLPFVVVGSVGLVVATALLILIPNVRADVKKKEEKEEEEEDGDGEEKRRRLTFSELARHPSTLLPFLDNTVCFLGNGLVVALMAPHLSDDAGATQGQVAVAFLVFGAAFAVGSISAGFVREGDDGNSNGDSDKSSSKQQ